MLRPSFGDLSLNRGGGVCKGSELFKIDSKGDLNGPQACIEMGIVTVKRIEFSTV